MMKKIFIIILTISLITLFVVFASATVFKKGDTLDVHKGAIILDGRDTNGEYGDYLAYVTGAELLAAQQKITAETWDYANGYMCYIGTFNAWFEDELYNEWDWAKEMEMGLKAKYDDEALYILVTTVYPKSVKFFFNPEVNGTGNCMQFIFAAADNYTGMCVSDIYKDGTDFDMYLCPESASSVAFANYNNDPIYTEDYALDCFKAFYNGGNTFSYELKFEFEPLKITVNPGTVEFYFGAGLMVNTRVDCDVAGLACINLGSVVFGSWSKPNNPDGQRCDIKDYGYGFRLLATNNVNPEIEKLFTYNVVNGKTIITGFNNDFRGEIIIPSTLGGYTVTGIGDSAFAGCQNITGIVIPNTVKSIGESAFSSCIALESITIPYSVTNIGSYVFNSCSNLANITVANGNPVYHCNGNCIIKTDTKELICGCKNSVIPHDGSVTKISSGAFSGCFDLTSINIPDSVTDIGNFAFDRCISLANIIIGHSVKRIGTGAFYKCKAVTQMNLPDNLTIIESEAFEACDSLKIITIPETVNSIGLYAFDSCGSLTDVYYNGTKSKWESLANRPTGVTVHYSCSHKWDSGKFTKDVSCEKNGEKTYICSLCGEIKVEIVSATGHSFGAWYITKKADCTTDGIETRICSKCNNKEERTVSAVGHIFGSFIVTKAASCEQTGEKTATCSACGKTEVEVIQSTGHNYGSWEKYTATQHKHICSVCAKIEKTTHTWDSGKITKNANCKESGEKEYSCTVCDEIKKEIIAKKSTHNYSDWQIETNATCDTKGLKKRTCSVCEKVEREEISAKGHAFRDWITATQPTCIAKGVQTKTCSECGKIETKEIPAKGHSFGDWKITKEATNTEKGEKIRTCSVCGETEKRSISVKGHTHTFGDWKVTKTATCVEKGMITRICSACGETEDDEIAFTEHSYNSGVITRESNCAESGEMEYSCIVCGEIRTEVIERTSVHNFGEWVVIRYPTISTYGILECLCSRCGKKLQNEIPCKISDVNTGIVVEADEGVFNEGTEIVIESFVETDERVESLKQILKEFTTEIKVYDIKAVLDGAIVQPNGKANIMLPVPEEYGNDVAVVCVHEDGTIEKLECAVNEEGTLCFVFDCFESYAICRLNSNGGFEPENQNESGEKISSDEPANSDKSGDLGENKSFSILIVSLITGVALFVVVFLILCKKRKSTKDI